MPVLSRGDEVPGPLGRIGLASLQGVLVDFWQSVAALVVSAAVIMGSPGPSNLSAAAVGAAFGARRAAAYVAGLASGTLAVLLMVSFGLLALLTTVPLAAVMLKVASAIYLMYLAYRIGTAPPLRADLQGAAAPAYPGGFLLGVANPKAYFAIAAVVAGNTLFPGDARLDGMAKGSILVLLIVAFHLLWMFLGAGLARFLRDPGVSRAVNVAMAVALLLTGAMALLR